MRKCLPKIKFFKNIATQFVHDTIDFVMNGVVPTSKYPDVSESDLTTIFEAFKYFFCQILKLNLSESEIGSDLKTLNVGEEDQTVIISALLARWNQLKQKLSYHSVNYDNAHLVDFDWKLHVSLSSNSISQFREPLLLLNLYITDENLTQKELLVELTKDDLDMLIQHLETVNNEVIKLKF
uniref:COMM domain-containing protein n=1 Tax=Arcella intermedia TaxID=1963864 RepID=A0A6B2LKP2_9EUKA